MERSLGQRFNGFETRLVVEPVWTVGAPNAVVGGRGANVRALSRCLNPGDPYEVEAMVSSVSNQHAALAASVLDTTRAAWQLIPPISGELLIERDRSRVSHIECINVPVLVAVGVEAEVNLGLCVNYGVAPLVEDVWPLKAAVRKIRNWGWGGAILLPGYEPDIHTMLIPRLFANPRENGNTSWLRIAGTAELSTPPAVVEYVLGRRRTFPGRWNGFDALDRS